MAGASDQPEPTPDELTELVVPEAARPQAAGERDPRGSARGALPDHRAAGSGRLRRGLPRARQRPGAGRGGQAHPPGGLRRGLAARGREATLPARSPGGRAPATREHRDHARHRRDGGDELHRHGARPGKDASGGAARAGSPAARRDDRAHGAGGGRSRPRAREPGRPPRREAGEHHDRARRPRESDGLRDRQARDRHEPHHDRLDHGHAELHVPGAGEGDEGGRALRPLLARLRAVRMPDRHQAVPGRERLRDPREDPHGGAAPGGLQGDRPAARDRRRPEARPLQGPGRALRLGRPAARGAAHGRPDDTGRGAHGRSRRGTAAAADFARSFRGGPPPRASRARGAPQGGWGWAS